MKSRTVLVIMAIALGATVAPGTNSDRIAKPGGGYTTVIEGRTDGGTTGPSNVVSAVRPAGVRPERPQFQSPPMPAATQDAILLSQDFSGTWSTLNPPAGWTITFTGDGPDDNDWHNGGGYAALYWYPFDVGQTDILMSPVIDCGTYANILLQCYTDYNYYGGGYTAVIEGSTDGGSTWPVTIHNYNNMNYGPGTETFNINAWAGGQSQVRIRWRGYGDIYNINWWYVDNVLVIPEVLDAATISIDSPVGPVIRGGTYNPKATVQNLGNSPESLDVVFSIDDGSGYASTKPTPMLAPNEKVQLTFDPWHPAGAGSFQTKCSTELAGDMDNTNDKQVGTVKVWPAGWAQTTPVPLGPGTRVKHGGWLAHKPLDQYVYTSKGGATGEFYRYDIEGAPGFEWKTLASIPGYGALGILPGDGSRGIHDGGNSIYATTGNDCPGFWRYDIANDKWSSLPDVGAYLNGVFVPANLGGGTDLVCSPGTNVKPLQVVTGGYTYGPVGWGMYSMGYKFTPTQPGAVTQLGRFRGSYNEESTIKLWDAANGNLLATANVTGTDWSYADITPVVLTVGHEYWVTTYGGTNVYYYAMPYVPCAVNGVQIIDGGYGYGDGMPTWPGYGYVYGMADVRVDAPDNVCLVQGNQGGFFRYDAMLNQWASLGKAPPQGGKWKSGSFLAYDGYHTIYAHRAECSPCELWAYDVPSGPWSQLRGMPGTKSQAGGCGDWYHGGIYALKGANTNEFWRWDASTQWNALDPIPGVGVAMGADIVSHGDGAFFALKGGNTREFWRYGYVPKQSEGVQGSVIGIVEDTRTSLTLTPSPLVGNVLRIGYNLIQVGPASVTLFDISGRAVVKRDFVAVRTGQLPLDLRLLSAGVYLVRLEDGHQSVVQKLVVQR